MKLTDAYARNVKPNYYRTETPDAVLPGMYLIVQPSGARSWAVRYRHDGRPRKLTLGSYPAIGLATARDLARETACGSGSFIAGAARASSPRTPG